MAESATPPLAKSIVKISFILYANDSDLSTCEESNARNFSTIFQKKYSGHTKETELFISKQHHKIISFEIKS